MIADVDVCNFYIHNMASRLLHQIARELCLMELPQWAIWLSMVRKCMNIPISSRSEMVMLPVGFDAEHSLFLTTQTVQGVGCIRTRRHLLPTWRR